MPTVNTQLKYKLAIQWCEANRAKLPRYCKFKLYTTERLYRMLEGFGVAWSVEHKGWYTLNGREAPTAVLGKQGDWRGDTASGRTLVRIIAKSHLIGKRVAEFTELCEALNWNVLKVSNPVGDNGEKYVRVYITIVVEDGD